MFSVDDDDDDDEATAVLGPPGESVGGTASRRESFYPSSYRCRAIAVPVPSPLPLSFSVRRTALPVARVVAMSSSGRRREAVRLTDVFRKIAGMWHNQDALVTSATATNTVAEKESPLMTGK